MLDALLWWLALLLFGLAAFPIAARLLHRLPERGYGVSRALGLLLFGYLYWLLAFVLPNARGTVLLAAGVVVALGVWAFRCKPTLGLRSFWREQWKAVVATELVFGAVFVVWAVLRSHTPAIYHTEQPMDLAMLNSILRSPHFPPNDPWFAGESISYYYFGYLLFAGLTKLLGTAPAVAYNLAFPALAGMAAAGSFSLVYNLIMTWQREHPAPPRHPHPSRERVHEGASGWRSAILFGVVGVFLLLFIGNLAGFLEYLQANSSGSAGFWNWIGVDGLNGVSKSTAWYPNESGWWWWRATRVINSFPNGTGIDYTITEFPFFSFLLGDLHPHVMALPFNLLVVALAFALLRSEEPLSLLWLRAHWQRGLLSAMTLGALGFLNTWDLPTFTVLLGAALLLQAMRARSQGQQASYWSLVGALAVMVLAALFLYAPFYLLLNSQAKGILPVREAMTRPLHLLLVLGPLLVVTLTLLTALCWRPARDLIRARQGTTSELVWALAIPLAPFLLWAAVELALIVAGQTVGLTRERTFLDGLLAIGSRFWHLLPLMALLAWGVFGLLRLARGPDSPAGPTFVLLLALTALSFVYGAELFRIADLFGNRMNTIFKFYYQAWTLLAAVTAAGLSYWWNRLRESGALRLAASAAIMAALMLTVAAFIYVPAAAKTLIRDSAGEPTLNGLEWLRVTRASEYMAVQALLADAPRGKANVLIEGVPVDAGGNPQGDYDSEVAAYSQRTGLPAVLGWGGHEQQWGREQAGINARARDIQTLYISTNAEEIRGILRKYDVNYVIVGDTERRAYGARAGATLPTLMDILYSNERVVIYKRPSP